MVIVNTHAHASPWWYEPIEVTLFHMDRNGVDTSVLVQIRSADNTYNLENVRNYPGRFIAAVRVNGDSPNAPGDLEYLAEQGATAVRLHAKVRSPGSDPVPFQVSMDVWRKAAELKLAVSCSGGIDSYISPEFRDLVETFPDMPIVLEHTGGGGRDISPPYTKFKKVLELAHYPNVHMKVHSLGEYAPRPVPDGPFLPETVPPLAQMACEAFGPRRLMWASDSAGVSGREGYANSLRQPIQLYSAFLNEEEKEWFFGKTALQVFRFPET